MGFRWVVHGITKHLLIAVPPSRFTAPVRLQESFENSPLTLSKLFCTAIGRKTLEAFLGDTGICTPNSEGCTEEEIEA